MSAKTITFAFQKGGIAKTTSACNFGAGLKKSGYKVLLVDSDTQSSLSRISGADISGEGIKTLTDVLRKECTAEEAIQHLDIFDIIPSNESLIAFQDTMPGIANKDFLISRAIVKPLADKYDYIIFDTNASFCDLAKNAIVAAQKVVIPMIADEQSYSSLPQQITTIGVLNEGYEDWKAPTEIAGILITMYHQNEIVDKTYDKRIKEYAADKGIKVFDTHIRFATAIKQSQTERKNIFDSKADSGVALDYFNFVREFLDMEDKA